VATENKGLQSLNNEHPIEERTAKMAFKI